MKNKKLISRLLILIIIGIVLVFNLRVKAQQGVETASPQQDVVGYLQERLKQQNVPFTQMKILQESPLEIEITLQSISTGEKFAPDDFINLHLTIREAVLANERGYNINGLTEVVLNKDGKTIDWGWSHLIGVYYLKLAPSTVTDALAMGLVDEKINTYGMSVVNKDVSSFDGFKTLNLDLSTTSFEEANQTVSQIKDALGPLAKDINAQGAQVVMVRLKVKDEKGAVLLNYLRDLQFETEGWWAAEGINIDSWYPSIPAPMETDLPTQSP